MGKKVVEKIMEAHLVPGTLNLEGEVGIVCQRTQCKYFFSFPVISPLSGGYPSMRITFGEVPFRQSPIDSL